MTDFEPSAPSSSTPTLYLSERVNGCWPGVSRRCSACSPAGLLRLDEPEGKYPGSLVCMTCAREPFVVRQDKPLTISRQPIPADAPLCMDHCGRPARLPGKGVRVDTRGRCAECYTRWKNRQSETRRIETLATTPPEARPKCIVCGRPSQFRRSIKYCNSHLAMSKRGTLGLHLRAQEAGR